MWFQFPSEALECAPGSKQTTAVHTDAVPAPSRALDRYAQYTPDNQTITNFRVYPREHLKERILLNIIELPDIDVGGLAYLARRFWHNASGTAHQARRVRHGVSAPTFH